MTSKNSFFNILIVTLRSKMWGLALSCLGFFFAFPVYAALCASIARDRVAREILKPGMEAALFARDAIGENNFMLTFAVIILAAFLAFNSFSYLYSKSKVDLFHAVPIKRRTLFAAEYLAGVLVYIIPYLVFLILALLVGAVNGMLDSRGLLSAVIILFINLLGFLGIYNTAIIAIAMTGNMAVGVIGFFVFIFYGMAANLLSLGYQAAFFITRSDYSENIFMEHCSPVYAFIDLTSGMSSFRGEYNLSAGDFALYILFVAASLGIALWLFVIRSSEATGKSMVFKKSMPVISVMLLILAALVGGIVFEEFSRKAAFVSYGWYAFGFFAALIIGHCIIQAIYYLDFKSLLKNLINPAIAGVIAAVIAAIFIFDLTGYDSYIPADGSYESAAISSYALQGYVEYYDFDAELLDEYGGRSINQDMMQYRLDNIKITDKDLIRQIAQAGIEESKKLYFESRNNQYNEEYVDDADNYAAITVKYNMNNGKAVYRNYNIMIGEHMDLYNRLYADESYKNVTCPMMQLNPSDASDIGYMGAFEDADLKLSDEDTVALVKAYQADCREQTADDLAKEIPYGFLYRGVTYKEDGYSSFYYVDKAYVYPSYARTLAILEKYDVNLNYYKDIDNIMSVVVYNYEAQDETGNTVSKEYTDPKDIAAIMENAYPNEFIMVESVLHTTESADITVNFKNSPFAYVNSVSYTCLKGGFPGNVMSDLGIEE